jgi:single-stranded-DNA-specific exonuclease
MLWKRHTPREQAASHYARAFDISELTAQILLNRGVNGLSEMKEFLSPSFSALHDPMRMLGMEAAVERTLAAVDRGERVHVHGDYDVDGVTATAVLMLGLRAAGANVHYHVINRADASVGLSELSLLRDHVPLAPGLLITADCGSSSVETVALAKQHGIDVIIVDHHVPGPVLPDAVAMLNPMQPGCAFPFRSLAACGVAFNFVLALHRALDARGTPSGFPLHSLMDLVALGTIADLVPLTDENRTFVRDGLALVASARRPGICALMRSARLFRSSDALPDAEEITPRTIGYRLAPLLNAAGRMDDANKCVELLITDSYRVADAIARELQSHNQLRQQCEREVLADALTLAEAQAASDANVLVLVSRAWHPGVLGIVASRLVDRFHRPAIVAAVDGLGLAKGSVRAPDSVDMLDALGQCADLLETWGGHRAAAGVAFAEHNADAFTQRVRAAVAGQLPDGALPERTLQIDAAVTLDQLTGAVLDELDRLAPFGAANPEPLLEARGVQPIQARVVAAGNVRLRLRQNNRVVDAVAVGMGKRIEQFRRPFDLAFTPRVVRTSSGTTVEIMVKDISPARG